ncbi:hypothetical protein AVEN_235620-1 [Araneus ventricosus]|uniref:Uncharacterized protein n=1 Tax=Araneus ventricosus TaxID=182803 RepID=A0A4Y2BR50_ARAVE|nr:hypothetical protein AVEN_235620-1 [Araneus ventricosus]
MEYFGHSPYNPDLIPSDFHLFGPLKKNLAGRQFRKNAEVQEAVVKLLRDLDPDLFYVGFDRLVYRRYKCFSNHGSYVEKGYVPVTPYCLKLKVTVLYDSGSD